MKWRIFWNLSSKSTFPKGHGLNNGDLTDFLTGHPFNFTTNVSVLYLRFLLFSQNFLKFRKKCLFVFCLVWYVLERCPVGIQIGQFLIPQQPTLSQMTNYDLRFAMLVEEMFFVVTSPNYRQILIEASIR